MANNKKKDQMRYIEIGNFLFDFQEGDILLFDSLRDISPLYPMKPMTTMIVMVTKGWQKLTANGQVVTIKEGDILISPPEIQVSGSQHSQDFDCRVLCANDRFIRSLLRDKTEVWHHAIYTDQPTIIPLEQANREEFSFYFSLIHSKLKRDTQCPPAEILMALMRALLLELCFILESGSSTAQNTGQRLSQGKMLFNKFLSLVSNSPIKRQPINLYAEKLAITPKYLTMLCLKYSNKTASEWVAQYTVEDIRFYLRSTEISIKEISARLGFSNMSHFGSYVRKHLGVSPTEYRFSKSYKQGSLT